MAMPFLNSTETPLNFSKFKNSTKSSNLKSFWAFLLFVFLYMSAFYLFNLSPSSLLSTTKFWFFISNTLIIIIAADFGSFSSSKQHDFYAKNSIRAKNVVPISFSPQDNRIMGQYEKETEEKPHEYEPAKSNEIQENNKPELLTIKEEHDHKEDQQEITKKRDIIVHPETVKKGLVKKKRKSKWARSKSDKAMLMWSAEEENREKKVLQRTLSDKSEEETSYEDNNSEFSNMSNEELNKRVEEFIKKCNRQIRLQAVRSRQDERRYFEEQSRIRL